MVTAGTALSKYLLCSFRDLNIRMPYTVLERLALDYIYQCASVCNAFPQNVFINNIQLFRFHVCIIGLRFDGTVGVQEHSVWEPGRIHSSTTTLFAAF